MKNYAFSTMMMLGLAEIAWAQPADSVEVGSSYSEDVDSVYVVGEDSARTFTVEFYYGDSLLERRQYGYDDWPDYYGNTYFYNRSGEFRIIGWEPEIGYVKEDIAYHAIVDSSINRAWVYFHDAYGYTIEEKIVDYGKVPEFSGKTPTKVSWVYSDTKGYVYTFKRWDAYNWDSSVGDYVLVHEGLDTVWNDVVYYAVFDSALKQHTIKFVDYDGSLISEQKYDYGTAAADIVRPDDPVRDSVNGVSYEFVGWTPGIRKVDGDVVYVAKYESSNRTYTVAFTNGAEVLQIDEYTYDAYPEYLGEEPTKESNERYDYPFTGWCYRYDGDEYCYSSINYVYESRAYEARFDYDYRKYWVKFVDEDGTLIDSVAFSYGDWPHYDFSKADTSDLYAFSNWEPRTVCVTDTATYRASYRYRVQFVMDDGRVLKSEYYYPGEEPYYDEYPKKDPANDSIFSFAGWDKEITKVTEPVTYKAVFEATYVGAATVVPAIAVGDTLRLEYFVDGAENKNLVVSLSADDVVDLSRCPAIQYEYKGWSHRVMVNSVYASTDAGYVVRVDESADDWEKVTLYWRDFAPESWYSSNTISLSDVRSHFKSFVWVPDYSWGDLEVRNVACIGLPTYTIRFYDGNNLIKKETYAEGEMPAFDDDEISSLVNSKIDKGHYHYTWKGWDREFVPVTETAVYKAQFDSSLKVYEVGFYFDGRSHYDYYTYGTIPEYGETPFKSPDDYCNRYVFSGWYGWIDGEYVDDIRPVTSEAYYDAEFKCAEAPAKELIEIVFLDDNGDTLRVNTLSYGQYVSRPQSPSKPSTKEYEYTFVGWDSYVDDWAYEPATYTAVYDSSKRYYAVRFMYGDNYTLSDDWYPYGTPLAEIMPPVPERNGRTFEGWLPVINEGDVVTEDISYVASYYSEGNDTVVGTHTVVFMNGTEVLQVSEVRSGEIPEYTGYAPYKAPDERYTYEWSEAWDKELEPVTGATVYNAKFDETPMIYEVVFLDANGDTLLVSEYTYGGVIDESPSPETLSVVKDSLCTFDGWRNVSDDGGLRPVMTDEVYVASALCPVKFYGSVEGEYYEVTLPFGSRVWDNLYNLYNLYDFVYKNSSSGYYYNIKTFEPSEYVTSAESFKAVYDSTRRTYEVVFKYGKDTLLSAIEYEYGTPASEIKLPEEIPAKENARFLGWNPEVSAVTGDVMYEAKFLPDDSYIISWLDTKGNLLDTSICVKGETPVFKGDAPAGWTAVDAEYVFDGWDVQPATGDTAYVAVYAPIMRKYKVTFANYDGTVLKETLYTYGTPGEDIVAPAETPERSATEKFVYTFAGWDAEFVTVTGDTVYTAKYISRKRNADEYMVTFMDSISRGGDNLEILSQKYQEGTAAKDVKVPSVTDTTIGNCFYKFEGWSPKVEKVIEDAVYTASYKVSCKEVEDKTKDTVIVVHASTVRNSFKVGFANNVLNVAVESPSMVRVQVLDMAGRVIETFNESVAGSRAFALEHLNRGTYLVRITNRRQTRTARITVK